MTYSLNTWKHPKNGETRVYLNGTIEGVKIYAYKTVTGDSYRVIGFYNLGRDVPAIYTEHGHCWAINLFTEALEEIGAPNEAINDWTALVDFANK